MARQRALVAAVVVTLALGIGANTAVFSLIDAVLLHPLPVEDLRSLVAIYNASNPNAPRDGFPYPTHKDQGELEKGNPTTSSGKDRVTN